MKERLKDGVLILIHNDRRDEQRTHRDLIAKLIHIILALNFYKELFEKAYLKETEEFFKKDSCEKFHSLNVNITHF